MVLMNDKKTIIFNCILFAIVCVGYMVFMFTGTTPQPKYIAFESMVDQVRLEPLNVSLASQPEVEQAPSAPKAEGMPQTAAPNVATLFRGKKVLLHFWASWCEACESDHKFLNQLAKNHPDAKFKIVGIATSDSRQDIEKSGRLSDAAFENFLDAKGDIAMALKIKTLPQTLLIDSDGRILQHFNRALDAGQTATLETVFTNGGT